MKYTVVLTDERHPSYEIERNILKGADARLVAADHSTPEAFIASCAQADALMVDMAPCGADLVNALERCKIISRYGVGYDNVDVDACSAKGILVSNVPDYCTYDVSDHALALMLDCMRGVTQRDRRIRRGEWNISIPHSYRMKGRTLSIIGFGRIGRRLAEKVSGFGFARILAYDPYTSSEDMAAAGVEKVDFDTALSQGDMISIHVPCTDETKGLFDARAFSLMQPHAILVNTARGPIVDPDALLNALTQHQIASAGIDTHAIEPIPADSPFLELENIVLTDHTAYCTYEATIALKEKAAQNVAAALQGKIPMAAVNRECLSGRVPLHIA